MPGRGGGWTNTTKRQKIEKKIAQTEKKQTLLIDGKKGGMKTTANAEVNWEQRTQEERQWKRNTLKTHTEKNKTNNEQEQTHIIRYQISVQTSLREQDKRCTVRMH